MGKNIKMLKKKSVEKNNVFVFWTLKIKYQFCNTLIHVKAPGADAILFSKIHSAGITIPPCRINQI